MAAKRAWICLNFQQSCNLHMSFNLHTQYMSRYIIYCISHLRYVILCSIATATPFIVAILNLLPLQKVYQILLHKNNKENIIPVISIWNIKATGHTCWHYFALTRQEWYGYNLPGERDSLLSHTPSKSKFTRVFH